MEANKLEVSLRATDIADLPSTTIVESLVVTDIHMLLDGTLNGTYQSVNVQYPSLTGTVSSVVTTRNQGTVSPVACN